MPSDTETAYAKINLALHVRRRRDDGYHDIETLFAFAQHGDQLQASLSDTLDLVIDGPFGSGLSADKDNLVMQAAHRLRAHFSITDGASIRLTKNLPIASGIGGGSADAAAAARLLNRLWDIQASEQELADVLAPLGADIPACIFSRTSFGSGTGTALELCDDSTVPARQSVSTAAIFKAWDGQDKGPVAQGDIWQAALAGRNDLEPIAANICPAIYDILNVLERTNASMVRMSGSGATCFALFAAAKDLEAAKALLDPRWWSMGTELR
jgi:4-diphosphocytidyl-2-C-methyl-D-erythritol kinase